ncbi:MAG: pyrimidine-nucleoside phosphorylase [Clostridia bacterium]|jgi:pyrimidine-nucleoside phosphorylase|nr:pyrimidine-nucleoside phosphorylase [Clostridia bacterium]
MRVAELIVKKREGLALNSQEIEYLVHGYTQGEIPDYQMSALLMAVFFRGMTEEETAALTLSMATSGETADLSALPGLAVDKHSTGGVADTTTLALAPWAASCGVTVAKMSGRGLGHTGGTIDKLESIPGFRTSLTQAEFIKQVREINIAVAGQSGSLAPADQKLYALRDVTGTVESIPLIASSIMSKKIAAGAGAIVLDVKTGSGAFMKNPEEARKLARAMVAIGKNSGRRTVAVVSDMNEPLGSAIGNALEVEEAIQVLRGETKGRLLQLCLSLGAQMLILAGKAADTVQAEALLQDALHSGRALQKMAEFISAQGGDPAVLENTALLPRAAFNREITAPFDGYFFIKDTQALGYAAMLLGAGRERKDSVIDLAVGLKLGKRNGAAVKSGEPLLTVYYNREERLPEAVKILEQAIAVVPVKPADHPLVYEIIA